MLDTRIDDQLWDRFVEAETYEKKLELSSVP
jgi:hypothetical protein